ncbi:MAG: pilus assembly protein TadG-related protein [Dehalococcoidales bacterium]|nr:pilus assembly protein TadG-related protein [Dehalococcoidales bacterium]
MKRRGESGQTLVFFTLIAVVLLGAVALVVDVGRAYAERRHLQNVADEAALAGAQGLPNSATVTSLARTSAQNNGATLSEVAVSIPPTAEGAPYTGSTNHVQVKVARDMPTFFARVFGRDAMTVEALAVATDQGGSGDGAIIALDNGNHSIDIGGNAALTVNGSIWANGDLNTGGTADQTVTGSVSVGGDADLSNPNFHYGSLDNPVTPMGDPLANLDPPTATTGPGCVPATEPDWEVCYPGTYPTKIKVTKNAMFLPGVYVITGSQGLEVQGTAIGVSGPGEEPWTWGPISDSNMSNLETHRPWGPVHFYLTDRNAGVTVNAGADFLFEADLGTYNNLVIWNEGKGEVKINGGGAVSMYGSIYAPNANVKLVGNAYTPMLTGQVIADTVTIEGNNATVITYDSNYAPRWPKCILTK